VREVASKTSDLAGDGTTTATVLAASIMKEGIKPWRPARRRPRGTNSRLQQCHVHRPCLRRSRRQLAPVPTPRSRAAGLATGNDLDIVIVTDEEAIRKFPGRRITPSEST
jgi:hypothetical protein